MILRVREENKRFYNRDRFVSPSRIYRTTGAGMWSGFQQFVKWNFLAMENLAR